MDAEIDEGVAAGWTYLGRQAWRGNDDGSDAGFGGGGRGEEVWAGLAWAGGVAVAEEQVFGERWFMTVVQDIFLFNLQSGVLDL